MRYSSTGEPASLRRRIEPLPLTAMNLSPTATVVRSTYWTRPLPLDLISGVFSCATPPMWERTHGQLGARLTDGLGGDDADRGAAFDHAAGRRIEAVGGGRDRVHVHVRERGEDLDAVETDGLDALGEDFVDELAGLHDDFGRIERVRDVFGRAAAHDAFGEGDEELVAVVDRGLPDAVRDVHVDAVDAGVAELGHQLFGERGFGLREELGGAGGVRDVGGQVTAEGGVAERDDV